MVGLDLTEENDGFALSVTDPEGHTTKISLTVEQVLTLAHSAALFQDRILARHSRKEAAVKAVYTTPVTEVVLNTDLLKERILLTLVAPNGAQVVHELTPYLANYLVQCLPGLILEILSGQIPKQ